LLNLTKRSEIERKKLIFLMTLKLHGVLTVIMVLLRSFHGVITRYGVLIGDYLRLNCASTEFFALPLRFHGAYTALSRRSHCAYIVLHIPAITDSE
jgi:hypothetical protein